MRKLFRFHRGSLAESLQTTIDVIDLYELRQMLAEVLPYAHNVRISRVENRDDRLPAAWGSVSRYVLADFDGYSGQCVGMCNFYEE